MGPPAAASAPGGELLEALREARQALEELEVLERQKEMKQKVPMGFSREIVA